MAEKSLKPQIRFAGFTEDWEQRKLGEIFEQNIERNENQFGSDKTISIATMVFKNEGNGASQESIPLYKVLRVGDIAFEGHTNKQFRYGRFVLNDIGDGIMSPRFSTLRPKSKLPFPFWKQYIHYEPLMRSVLARSTKSGTMMNELVVSEVLEQSIPVPLEKEQYQIGTFFTQLDNLITLHQRKCDKLINFKKAMLEKMFPKDGADVPEIRFAGFTGAWEKRELGELMDVTSVKRIHQSDWTDSGIRFLRARDIVAAAKNEKLSDCLYISETKYNEYSALSGKVQKGDLLVTGVGTIGVPMLIRDERPLYFKDGNIIWFKNANKIAGEFLYYSFISSRIQNFIKSAAGIGTVGTYTIESGKKTPILLPKFEEQMHIASFIQGLDRLITLHQRELEKLKNIKKAMLDKMFV